MKLYIVGEYSSDPENWSAWSEWSLVIAESPEQARKLANAGDSEIVTEIPMNKAVLLYTMPEPRMGDDL